MLVFSDLHLHINHPVCGRKYLDLGINALNQIREFALKNNETEIVHLGDTFNLKDRVPSGVWVAFLNELSYWADVGLSSYWLKGNHDYQTDVTISAFRAISNAHPIIGPTVVELEEMCAFLPHGSELPEWLIREAPILFMHDFFLGKSLKYGSVLSTEGVSIPENFKLVMSGHSHLFQEIEKGRVFHIGSPYQTTFNEVGQKKFFAQISSTSLKFHPFTYPEFIELDMEDEQVPVQGSYVKVKYNADKFTFHDLKLFRKQLEDEGALGVKIEPRKTVKEKRRITLTQGEKGIDYLSEYVKLFGGDLDKKKLVQIGNQLIEQSKEVTA